MKSKPLLERLQKHRNRAPRCKDDFNYTKALGKRRLQEIACLVSKDIHNFEYKRRVKV